MTLQTPPDALASADALQCASEAIKAHGNTSKADAWYRRWKPNYYAEYGLPTTVQYSLSCFLMDHAAALLQASPGIAGLGVGNHIRFVHEAGQTGEFVIVSVKDPEPDDPNQIWDVTLARPEQVKL